MARGGLVKNILVDFSRHLDTYIHTYIHLIQIQIFIGTKKHSNPISTFINDKLHYIEKIKKILIKYLNKQ